MDQWITATQIAEMYNITRGAIHKARREGRITEVGRLGIMLIFDIRDAERVFGMCPRCGLRRDAKHECFSRTLEQN